MVLIVSALVERATYARSAQSIAGQVGAHYGDAHPRIVSADATQTDNPPHDPMYTIILAGHFHHGRQIARYLSFSALADKTYVWAICGYNRPGTNLWVDDELEPLPK